MRCDPAQTGVGHQAVTGGDSTAELEELSINARSRPEQLAVTGVATVLGTIGNLADHALIYAEHGLEVFPVNPRDKTPLVSQYDATTDTGQIEAWWQRWSAALIGHRLPDDQLILDIDPKSGGDHAWRALKLAAGIGDVTTRAHLSGRGDGGGHTWWHMPGDKITVSRIDAWAQERGLGHPIHDREGRQVRWTGGIDLLHRGHRYTILPPSPHPDTGKPYQWAPGRDLTTPVQPLPQFLVDLIVDDEPPAPPRPPRDPDPDSIADWYTDHQTWAGLLHDWRLVGGDGESDGSRWRHPTATSKFSATIRHGCLFVYSPNTVFEVTAPGNPHGYTKFAAYAALEHRGDQAAAARAARTIKTGPSAAAYMDDDWSWVPGYNQEAAEPAQQSAEDHSSDPAGEAQREKLTPLQRAYERYKRNHYHGDALYRIPPPVPLVEGLIDKGTLVVVYGPPASGKSQAVIDLAAHVTLGLDWCGRPTTTGKVVYFIGEGQYGIKARVGAWCDIHGHFDEVPVDWVTVAPNLLDVEIDSYAALAFIYELQPDLVIVDTLNRSMPGGEENGSKDISRVIAFAERVRELSGAATLFVHHAGKDVERGLRGHSSLLGAADTVLQVTDAGSGRIRVVVEKEKDHPDGYDLWFQSTLAAESVAVSYAPDIVGPPVDEDSEAWFKTVACLRKLQLLEHGNGVTSSDWLGAVLDAELFKKARFHEVRGGLVRSGHVHQPGGRFGNRYTLTDLGVQAIRDMEVQ